MPAQASGKDDLILRYRTYIGPKYTPALSKALNGVCTPKGGGSYRFSGDNRSWSATKGNSRTDMTMRLNWKTKKPTITRTYVGKTHRYKKVDGKWKLQASKQAKGTFTATTKTKGKDFALVEVSFSAKNPFCNKLGHPIKSKFVIRIEKKRVSIFGGSITAVPNHEIYIKRYSVGSYKTLKKVKTKSFTCLSAVPTCPTASLTTFWVKY